MKSVPFRHHYIPQFILKNFLDIDGKFYYRNNNDKTLSKVDTKNVFMNISMYRSEEINPNNPVEVENNLSKFENKVAPLFKRLLSSDQVSLSRSELESLRIFLSLLSFRSDSRMQQYKNANFDELTKSIISDYKGDMGFETFRKSEINLLADCFNYKDIENQEGIDSLIKTDFYNDLTGYYMTLIEARGGQFVISDIYPTLEIYPASESTYLYLHAIYPISPTRAILLNKIIFKKGIMNKKDFIFKNIVSLSKIKGDMLKEPKVKYFISEEFHSPKDIFLYSPVKIYKNDVTYINALFLNEVKNGFAFRRIDKIVDSVFLYNENNRECNKNNFDELVRKLKENN